MSIHLVIPDKTFIICNLEDRQTDRSFYLFCEENSLSAGQRTVSLLDMSCIDTKYLAVISRQSKHIWVVWTLRRLGL